MTCRSLCPILAFVPHDMIPDYEMLGWMRLAQLGPVHGRWSELIGFPCGCRPVTPMRPSPAVQESLWLQEPK